MTGRYKRLVWTQRAGPVPPGTRPTGMEETNPVQWLAPIGDKPIGHHEIMNLIIQHRPGTSNSNGDVLSRYPVSQTTSDSVEINAIDTAFSIFEGTNILDDIRVEQQKDLRLARIIQTLINTLLLSFGDRHGPYVLINHILYRVRHINSYNEQRLLGNKHLLVIPKSLQNQILHWAHDHPTAGHVSRIKILFRLSSRVYWPSMRRDVFKYIQSCPSCQKFKYKNAPTAFPMQLYTITQPWHTIGVDIMGLFPLTPSQKKFLLVIVDYFTRWMEMFALHNTTANDTSPIF